MPSFTPPDGDDVDFQLEPLTPPSGDAVDFEVGSGAGVSVTPDPAIVASSAVAPAVVLGAITITPAPAIAASGAIAPAVVAGPITLTPAAAIAASSAIAPTVHLGATSVTPAAAIAAATCVDPTVLEGSSVLLLDGLVSYWPLDEASGNAIDAHGSNDLAESSGTIDSATGKVNGARDFEAGDTEFLTVASNSELQTGDVSFEWSFWFNAESLANQDTIIRRGVTTGGQTSDSEFRVAYLTSGGGTLRFQVCVGTTLYTVNSGVNPTPGTWYHVSAWHDSVANLIGIAVNRSEVTEAHSLGVNAGTAALVFGASSGGYYDGLLDEVGFWKGRLLTSDERDALYNGGAGIGYSDFVGTAVNVTPDPAVAASYAIAPTVVLGATTATPAPAIASASAHAPAVVLGPVTVTPAAAIAVASAHDPAVVQGGVSITPEPAVAAATAHAPAVVLGPTTITPAPAIAQAQTFIANIIQGAISLTPDPAIVSATAHGPTNLLAPPTPSHTWRFQPRSHTLTFDKRNDTLRFRKRASTIRFGRGR